MLLLVSIDCHSTPLELHRGEGGQMMRGFCELQDRLSGVAQVFRLSEGLMKTLIQVCHAFCPHCID